MNEKTGKEGKPTTEDLPEDTAFSMDDFYSRYDTEEKELTVAGTEFRLTVPRTIDPFIEGENPAQNFPLWAKIWHASLVLANIVAQMTPEPDARMLEIGSGMGLVGVVAATFGHCVISTEYNADALAFSRANAEINQCEHMIVQKLDWNRPTLNGQFDMIIGSEVVYREKDFQPLQRLFENYLKPSGEVILTSGMRQTDMTFFKEMQEVFTVRVQKFGLNSGDEKIPVLLARMKPNL